MKAIRVHAPGGPETMKLEEVAAAAPAAGQAQVKLEACGVNYIDVYFRTGLYKAPLPLTPGMEGAGTVSAVGAGVSDVKVGLSVGMTLGFMLLCLGAIHWMFRTGYKLKN